MFKTNTKLLDNTLFDKQYILSDFIPEFDEYCENRSNFRFSYDTNDELLYKSFKNGKIHLALKMFIVLDVNHTRLLKMVIINVN